MPDFTACVLLYGDYPQLAERCLTPLLQLRERGLIELRIGCNAVSTATSGYLAFGGRIAPEACYMAGEGSYKYPMMRRLFYERPLQTPFVLWFDDDSYITEEPVQWLTRVKTAIAFGNRVLGHRYRIRLGGNQHLWLASRPWFRNSPTYVPGMWLHFPTGGWWTAQTALLQQWHWPDPDIQHRGGDVAFGALLQQQGIRWAGWHEGVAINTAKRRGHDEPPVGWNWQPGATTCPTPPT